MVRRKTRGKTPEKNGNGSAARETRNSKLILIVDDVADNRAIYADFLSFSGYRVIEATDGFEAVDSADRHRPDLILMDLSLPGMDGWEATRRIKSNKNTKSIPVVALTGHALEGHAKGARDAGCDAFIAKPCLPDVLEAKIREFLTATAE